MQLYIFIGVPKWIFTQRFQAIIIWLCALTLTIKFHTVKRWSKHMIQLIFFIISQNNCFEFCSIVLSTQNNSIFHKKLFSSKTIVQDNLVERTRYLYTVCLYTSPQTSSGVIFFFSPFAMKAGRQAIIVIVYLIITCSLSQMKGKRGDRK